MQIIWKIDGDDVKRVKDFVLQHRNTPLVEARSKNLLEVKPNVNKEVFWQELISARLTTLQYSGPDGFVAQLINSDPFPLSYMKIKEQDNIIRYILSILEMHKIKRFPNAIAKDIDINLLKLEKNNQWENTLRKINLLCVVDDKYKERETARYIQNLLRGFGPKQSRNLLQALGLTRYEIPIDTRVSKRLIEFGFPMKLNQAMLSSADCYELALDGIQTLCLESGVYPCILDAAMFSSFDGDKATKDTIIR